MKPTLLYTRPAAWQKCESKRLNLVYAPIFGDEPKLRSGGPMGESVGGVMCNDGPEILESLFDKHRPDFFLFAATYFNDGSKNQLATVVNALERVRRKHQHTVFLYWNGNQQGHPDFNVDAFKPFINVILINTHDCHEREMYLEYGIQEVETLHTFGFDPAVHGHHVCKPDYDCFFGGSQSYSPNKLSKYPKSKMRHDFFVEVSKRFKLLVHGKGKWPMPHGPYLDWIDYIRAFGRTKIALGMYHWDLERYYTKRTIYSLASGKLYVVHYIPGMEKDFENGKHLVWFNNVDEGLDSIEYYLEDAEKRSQIGRNGREIATRHHSWQARLMQIESITRSFTT